MTPSMRPFLRLVPVWLAGSLSACGGSSVAADPPGGAPPAADAGAWTGETAAIVEFETPGPLDVRPDEVVGIAVRVRKSGGKVSMARIGVTGLSNCSYRATAAEKALEGTAGSDADIQAAAALVAQGADANSDLHASAEYRTHLAKVHAARALKAALGKAK